jgi:SHS2 domain-containing protein
MPFRALDHTADTGIEATAASLTELIGELAAGMFALVSSPEPEEARQSVTVQVTAPTLEDLVVDALAELLYRAEVDDLLLCDFRVEMTSPTSVRIVAGGIPVSAVEPTGPPLKAVTYHDLLVEQRDEGWYGRVYFDV